MSKRASAAKSKEYIITDTGNKVSRKATILGSQYIILGGKTIIQSECTIRGDFRSPRTNADGKQSAIAIAIGRYCFLERNVTLRPAARVYKGVYQYYPMKLGDHVFIGSNTIIEAAQIGSYVSIGSNVQIGKFAIIKDCVRIEDDSVIPANATIASFSIVSGKPGLVVGELPESAQEEMDNHERYGEFRTE